MAEHKFKIGQTVLFRPRRRRDNFPVSARPYRIMHRLAAVDGEPQYRIKGVHTDHELEASEGELWLGTTHY